MRPNFKLLTLAFVGLALLGLTVGTFVCYGPEACAAVATLAGLGLGTFLVSDANLKVTKALPNGAATIYSDGIDLGHTSRGDFLADVELYITAPALATGIMGDGKTLLYSVQHDTDPAFGTAAVLLTNVLTQTGAGAAGCAAATVSVRLPVDVNRYIRVRAIGSAAGDCSTGSLTAELRA